MMIYWERYCAFIADRVGKRCIVAFEDALMAARATEIVKKAHLAGELPPHPFPIAQLGSASRKADLRELQQVLNLHHLARCVEHMILHWEVRSATHYDVDPNDLEERIFIDPYWRPNLYRAVYRIVLTGAVCCRAYMEPLFTAIEEGNIPIVESLTQNTWPFDRVRDHILPYLRRFPVYNNDAEERSERGRWRDREYEAIFDPLAKWLVEDGEARCIRWGFKTWARGPKDHSEREIEYLRAASKHLATKTTNGQQNMFLGRLPVVDRGEAYDTQDPIFGHNYPTRKVTVVLFGIFQLEEISVPVDIIHASRSYLVANPYNMAAIQAREAPKVDPSTETDSLTITSLFMDVVRLMPISDSISPPRPPPDAEFFRFVFHKYFHARFAEDAFNDHNGSAPYFSFAWPHIFCEGESADGGLFDDNPSDWDTLGDT